MLTIALTGSIGAGKSTAAASFARAGAAVASADDFVHELYAGAAIGPVSAAFPDAVTDGRIDRARLGEIVAGDRGRLEKLERIVHPLVRERERAFRHDAAEAGRRLVVVEVPLLVETGAQDRFDVVVVVMADEDVRRARVLQRPGMTPHRFAALAARQANDADKRRRAHLVMDNSGTPAALDRQVAGVIRAFAARAAGG